MKTLIAALVLAACAPVETETPILGDATEEGCGLNEAEALVGQDKDMAENLTYDGPIRVIGPGQAVTMDFNPNRLNIDYDERGIITRAWCG